MSNSRFVWIGSSGCFLPFLIIFNLFFGRFIFNSARLWLGIEAILILLFILSINIMARKIAQQGRGLASNGQSHGQQFGQQGRRPDSKVVDIQGQVVGEE